MKGAAMLCLGYVRRSKASTDDVRHGRRVVSVELQREKITEYAATHHWKLVDTVVDDGVSGGKRERLDRLAARVRATKAGVVIAYHLDRLARDAAALLDLLERGMGRTVEFHVVGRGRLEVQSAAGYLTVGVEGLVAAHFRKVISEKTRDALGRLRANGQRAGEVPYGFIVNGDGRTLYADSDEQAVLERLRALRAEGRSFRQIAATLNAASIPAKHGGRWWPETARSVLSHARATDNHRAVVVD
jgi:DNA invertase Pin-like site-specific DNA recombinase